MKIFGAYLLFFASAISAAAAGVAPFGASPAVSRREAEAVRAAAEASDNSAALEILLDASRKNWAGAVVFFNLGNAQMRGGDAESAVASYRRAAELSPSFFAARKNLGFALSQLGRDSDALAEMRDSLALSGGSDTAILLWFAKRAADARDFSSALNFCNQALLYDDSNRAALFAKAAYLYELGRFEECETAAKKLMRDAEFSARAVRLAGSARARRGDFCGAAAAFGFLEKSGAAERSDALFFANLLFKMRLYRDAAAAYARLGDSSAAGNAAEAMLASGDFSGAAGLAESLGGDLREKISGLAKFGAGDFAAARKHLEACVKKFPDDARVLCALGGACAELGDWGAADAHYARASLDPRFESAARYGMLRSAVARGDFVAAHSLAAALAKKYPEFSEYAKYLEKQISR